jgi:hypothetical protein
MQTETVTQERSIRALKQHSRNRAYALDENNPTLLRHADFLLRSCTEAHPLRDEELLCETVEEAVELGFCNAFKPRPIPEPGPIVRPRDPVTGEYLPDYWQTGDVKGQTFLLQHYPEWAEYCRRMKEDGPGYLRELKEKEQRRQVVNRTNGDYDAEAHKANPFTTDNKTDQSAFALNFPEYVWRIYQREAQPVSLEPLFTNQTLLGKIFLTDKRLYKILEGARQREKEFQLAEREKAIEQQKQDAIEAARQNRALAEQLAGIARLADGRIITFGGNTRIRQPAGSR